MSRAVSTSSLPPEPYRLTVAQYHAMIASGALTEDDPVELLEGMLVKKMPKNAPHRIVLLRLIQVFNGLLPKGWHYQSQEPITLTDGEPEPDGAVVKGITEEYDPDHPGPDDVAVVIEVSDSSLSIDRGIKLRSYARAGIAVYWIVNIPERVVEVYTQPDPEAKFPKYRKPRRVLETEALSLKLGNRRLAIPVGSILPPRH